MTDTDARPRARSKSGRSPSYPGVPLKAAIERAEIIWQHERRNRAPVSTMMEHWGYKNPRSGTASITFAALKKFGLVKDEGSGIDRPAMLTDLAFTIIHAPENERLEAVRKAALRPPIHRELWDTYHSDLPSPSTLKWELMQRGFTDAGADEFIRQYKETIAYARLGETRVADLADADVEEQDDPPDAGGPHSVETEDSSGRKLTIPVPIIGGPPITIAGVFPISEAAWNQFMAVLEAMKPGLVSRDDH